MSAPIKLRDALPWSTGDPKTKFKLEACLDEGAFGAVWRGKRINSKNDEEVAIKVMEFSEEFLGELKSEITFLDQFKSDFVISYYGTWFEEENQNIWIVMELAELGSLEGIMLVCEHVFTESELAALFARSLLGLSYVHSKGINRFLDSCMLGLVHQDIKAKNILLTLKGEVKLADFGVAASVTNVNQNRGTVSGSPHWMAPEILSGDEITQKSLGITLFELVEGHPPFEDVPPINVISLIPKRAAPMFSNPRQYTGALRSFLSALCQKDPEERKSSHSMLAHEFVINEVKKAHKGEHAILKKLAEVCLEDVQQFRNGLEDDDFDFEYGEGEFPDEEEGIEDGEVEVGSDSEDFSSEEDSDEDDFIVSNRQNKIARKKAKKKSSVNSIAINETVINEFEKEEKEAMLKRLRRRNKGNTKLKRPKGTMKPKHLTKDHRSRLGRKTRIGSMASNPAERKQSLQAHAYRRSIYAGARNLRGSFLRPEKDYEINVSQLKKGKASKEAIDRAEKILQRLRGLEKQQL
eukprot:maker-scaffold_7-snap-gene-10.29-mRNA-1 protein AED:0.01 eAED:0.02 QI:109/0.66/0.5/1/0.66/0.5/4/163/521